jgi:hypothetical protein
MNTILSSSTINTSSAAVSASASLSSASSLDAESRVGHLAATGFGLGGIVGALIGAAVVGIASMTTEVVLPGSSLYIAGPLSALLLGAGAGAANGGLAGALIGWGIPVELRAPARHLPVRRINQDVRAVLCPDCQ